VYTDEVGLTTPETDETDAETSKRAFGFENVVGQSAALREAVRLALRVASARRTTVLLIGES
jgi:transcriptional regulator with PAS, ATPase and Fis domain